MLSGGLLPPFLFWAGKKSRFLVSLGMTCILCVAGMVWRIGRIRLQKVNVEMDARVE